MEQEIDSFIRFLATERGLSDNYQLSTRRSLTEFAAWCSSARQITSVRDVTQPLISDYLSSRKKGGLSASSIKLVVVALKIFFRFLSGKGALKRDPTETLTLPRIERYLPETLNELQVERLIESIETRHPLGLRDRAIVELLYASGLAHFGIGQCASGKPELRRAHSARDGQGQQDAARAGGAESVHRDHRLYRNGAPEAGEAPQRERDFSLRPRDEADDRPPLANRQGVRAAIGAGDEYLSALAPP